MLANRSDLKLQVLNETRIAMPKPPTQAALKGPYKADDMAEV
jgi:hypothetical protein